MKTIFSHLQGTVYSHKWAKKVSIAITKCFIIFLSLKKNCIQTISYHDAQKKTVSCSVLKYLMVLLLS